MPIRVSSAKSRIFCDNEFLVAKRRHMSAGVAKAKPTVIR